MDNSYRSSRVGLPSCDRPPNRPPRTRALNHLPSKAPTMSRLRARSDRRPAWNGTCQLECAYQPDLDIVVATS